MAPAKLRSLLLLGLTFLVWNSYAEGSESVVDLKQQADERVFSDPGAFRNETYCYFVYQGIVNEQEVTPELYAKYVKGSSLSNDALSDYRTWLKTKDGKACKSLVGKQFKLLSTNSSKAYTIFLNQKAIESDGAAISTTLNHERLHVLFALRKADRKKIQDRWNQLSPSEKEEFKAKHPGYNYSNENVALREYFSYTFETAPDEGVKLLSR